MANNSVFFYYSFVLVIWIASLRQISKTKK